MVECEKQNNPKEYAPALLAHRLLVINLVAIHTTGTALAITLVNFFSSSPSDGFVDGVKEEAERIHAECGGTWTKAAIAKLFRTDSSMRICSAWNASNGRLSIGITISLTCCRLRILMASYSMASLVFPKVYE